MFIGDRGISEGGMQVSGHQGWEQGEPRSHGSQSVFHPERSTVLLNINMSSSISSWRTVILLLVLTRPCTEARPRPAEDKLEIDLTQNQKTGGSDTIGGGLETLISDMFNRIIQRRLENLLQGVTTPNKKDLHLLESSESLSSEELNKNSAFEEEFLEVSLPIAVTEIPQDEFTGLPGRLLVLLSFKTLHIHGDK